MSAVFFDGSSFYLLNQGLSIESRAHQLTRAAGQFILGLSYLCLLTSGIPGNATPGWVLHGYAASSYIHCAVSPALCSVLSGLFEIMD